MKMNLNQITEKGFTLVEVLIALAILSIGLLMAANLQITAISGNKGSSQMSVGTLLGQKAMEQLLTYNAATDPSLTAGTHTATTEAANHLTLIPDTTFNGTVFTRNYTVSTNNPIAGVRTISLNVQWTNQSNHQVALVERVIP
jgi:prepilin-type N-terminal cleavage/methylation domain-containing protein